jgi:general secretion pathway protein A
MYAHFYQLAEDPFNLTPDPKFHYVNESTREAMASILHGIKARKGFITLVGEAGTGKTTLLKRVVDEIEGETQVVFVFNPGVSFDELLEFICTELGIDTMGSRRLTLLERLNAYLLDQLTDGRNVVVMIDEAQVLDDKVLEELRLLSNLETAKEKILQILLAGQPELEEKLRKPQLRQLRQRVASRATLKPMRANEIGAYVETRLTSAGADRDDFFSPGALRKVWQASKGIPRVVNVICDNAMMIAFAEGKKRITATMMTEAIHDLEGQGGTAHTELRDLVERVREWLALPSARYAVAGVVVLAALVPLAMSMVPGSGEELMTAAEVVKSQAAQTAPVPPPLPWSEAAAREAAARRAAVEAPVPALEPNPVADTRRAEENEDEEFVDDVGHVSEDDWDASGSEVASDEERVASPLPRLSVNEPARNDLEDQAPVHPDVQPEPRSLAASAAAVADAPQADTGVSRTVLDSMRRAELLARSTAARLYDGRSRLLDDSRPGEDVKKPAANRAASAASTADTAKGAAAVPSPAASRGGRSPSARGTAAPVTRAAASPAAGRAMGEPAAATATRPDPNEIYDASKSLAAATETLADALASLDGRQGSPRPAAGPDGRGSAAAAAVAAPSPVPAPAAAEAPSTAPPRDAKPRVVAKAAPAPMPKPRPKVVVRAPARVAAVSAARNVVLGPAEGAPILGQQVAVRNGDTVWDIAVSHYGSAGPVTLKRILSSNPRINDPKKLEVGTHIYLPYQRPDQMVRSDGSSYRVVLAVSPRSDYLASAEAWVKTVAPGAEIARTKVRGRGGFEELYIRGLPSRDAALSLATVILAEYGRLVSGGDSRGSV